MRQQGVSVTERSRGELQSLQEKDLSSSSAVLAVYRPDTTVSTGPLVHCILHHNPVGASLVCTHRLLASLLQVADVLRHLTLQQLTQRLRGLMIGCVMLMLSQGWRLVVVGDV